MSTHKTKIIKLCRKTLHTALDKKKLVLGTNQRRALRLKVSQCCRVGGEFLRTNPIKNSNNRSIARGNFRSDLYHHLHALSSPLWMHIYHRPSSRTILSNNQTYYTAINPWIYPKEFYCSPVHLPWAIALRLNWSSYSHPFKILSPICRVFPCNQQTISKY